jgi:hypothetical protein
MLVAAFGTRGLVGKPWLLRQMIEWDEAIEDLHPLREFDEWMWRGLSAPVAPASGTETHPEEGGEYTDGYKKVESGVAKTSRKSPDRGKKKGAGK